MRVVYKYKVLFSWLNWDTTFSLDMFYANCYISLSNKSIVCTIVKRGLDFAHIFKIVVYKQMKQWLKCSKHLHLCYVTYSKN